jgi:hypothetical protein
VTYVTPWCCVEQREELLEERACVPTGQEFLLHSPKNAPGSAISFVLSGPQLIRLHVRTDDESESYVINRAQAASFSSFMFGTQLNSV